MGINNECKILVEYFNIILHIEAGCLSVCVSEIKVCISHQISVWKAVITFYIYIGLHINSMHTSEATWLMPSQFNHFIAMLIWPLIAHSH